MHYVGKVLAMDDGEGDKKTRAFADADFEELSRKVMNGRQVCLLLLYLFVFFPWREANGERTDQERRQDESVYCYIREGRLWHGLR